MFAHCHAVVVVINPRMTRGIRQVRDEDGTVVAEQLVIEGLCDVECVGITESCSVASAMAGLIDTAIEDPYDTIVDGTIKFLCMN